MERTGGGGRRGRGHTTLGVRSGSRSCGSTSTSTAAEATHRRTQHGSGAVGVHVRSSDELTRVCV